jgi:hypothetical protein
MIEKQKAKLLLAFVLLFLTVFSGSLYAEKDNHWAGKDDVVTKAPILSLRKGPYLVYPDDNTRMTVLWQLWETAICVLEWGLEDTSFPFSTQTHESGSAENEHQHSHTVSNLIPGTKYFYRVSAQGFEGYFTGSFRAAPPAGATDLKFMAYGDSRSNPAVHNIVAGAMVSTYVAEPDFQTLILSTGDLVFEGDNEDDWDDHLLGSGWTNIREMLANVPFHACMGNHEFPGLLFEKYLPYPFEAPRYWSFDYGPAHFVVVDQYSDYSPGSAQHAALHNMRGLKTTWLRPRNCGNSFTFMNRAGQPAEFRMDTRTIRMFKLISSLSVSNMVLAWCLQVIITIMPGQLKRESSMSPPAEVALHCIYRILSFRTS